MAMFGGMNLLSGTPMLQLRPQAGFVGGMNAGQKQSSDEYFANLKAMMDAERARNDARRSDRADRQFQNREMTLKELLGNSSIQDAAEQRQIARDRLGLDANTASSDADLRRNALSLQERLGLMGEDRMSNSDAAQNALAMQKFENDKFNQDRSFTQLSKEQQTNRDLAIKEMEQRRAMAEMPYNQMTQADAAQMQLGNRRLNQDGELARLPYNRMTLSDQWRNSLAEKQQSLDQNNFDATRTDRRFEFGNLSKAQEEQGRLENLKMSLTERLAEHPWTKGLTDAQRADIIERGLDRDQNRSQFNDNLTQRRSEFDQGQQNWNNEFSNKWTKLTPGEKARKDSETLDRKSREGMHRDSLESSREGHLMQMLGPYMEGVINGDPELRDRAVGTMRGFMPGPMGQSMTPKERATKALFDSQVIESQKSAVPQVKSIQDVSKQNAAAAKTLLDQHINQKRPLNDILKAAAESDRNSPDGAASTTQTLQQLLDAIDAENKRLMIRGQQMMQPSGPGNTYIPRHTPFMR